MAKISVLSPVGGMRGTTTDVPALPASLKGLTIGFLDNTKHNFDRLVDGMGTVLVDTFGLEPFAPPAGFGHAIAAYFAQPDVRTHTDLWRHCAHDFESLRSRVGSSWTQFEVYNIDRARSPAMHAAVPVGLGLALGAVGTFFATRLIESQLFGVTPGDPVTVGVVIASLTSVALAASLVPALRTVRLNPVATLRRE